MIFKIQNRVGFWLSLFIVIIAGVVLRAQLLDKFPLSPDEGIHLIWLRLLAAGYRPYEQVYITYPPLYPLAIEAVWHIWPTEAAQRWFSVVYAIFGVVGIALIARKFAGAITGVAATALLLFSPTLFEASRSVLGEFPSVAWSVWAVWLAWLYRERGQGGRIFLILSGLCLAASLLTKFLSPFLIALIPLIVLSRWVWLGDSPPVRIRKNISSRVEICHSERSEESPPTWWRFFTPLRSVQNDMPEVISLRTLSEDKAKNSVYDLKLGRYTLRLTDYKSLLIDLSLWAGALFLTILIFVFMFDINALFTQVVNQRLEARAAYADVDNFWQSRYGQGIQFFQDDMALVILAFLGLIIAWTRRQKDLWLLIAWLALALTMLFIHTPVRIKHFLILLPHLAILGGLAVSYWISTVNLWLKREQAPPIVTMGGLVLLIALSLWQIPATLSLWQARANIPQPPTDETEALTFVDEILASDDCMITDDTQFLYWSGRMIPPELAEVSTNRLKSGALTVEELVNISNRYDCQLVAAISNRIPQFLPDYMKWVEWKYLGRFHYGEDDIFFAKMDTVPKPAAPLRADFAGQITFHGYTLPQDSAAPGERLPLTLVWQAQSSLATDYTIFVQLRDAQNTVLASADHQPYQALVPTSAWPQGAVIQETTWLHLPAGIPPGQYNLYIGLYNPHNQERLLLVNDSSGENALLLRPVTVQ